VVAALADAAEKSKIRSAKVAANLMTNATVRRKKKNSNRIPK
jgi:hypothetical protein